MGSFNELFMNCPGQFVFFKKQDKWANWGSWHRSDCAVSDSDTDCAVSDSDTL